MPKKADRKKPEKKDEKPTSQKLSEADFEKTVIDLAKKGITSEKIGEQLRQQNIHPKEHSKKISQIRKENKLYIQPDIKNVKEKLERIRKHYEKNKQDKRVKREIDRVAAGLRKLKKYFGEQ